VKDLVELVDEDGSEMIEFEEFLQIIKGGSAAANQ
jgi:Ca2+-binding EF-hand superfamily protein